MTDINALMDADEREIVGRVEIVYSDLAVDASLVASATASGRYTYPNQVFDEVTDVSYKWFTLHDNKLDGTCHPMSGTGALEVGWWDPHLSDVDGVITNPATLIFNYDARHVGTIIVIGDATDNNFPVDFEVNLYDASDTLLYTEAVIGNTGITYQKLLPTVITQVTKATLQITRINKASAVPRVLEFFTAIKEIYDIDTVQSIQLLEELEYYNTTSLLGNLSSNEIDIILSNETGTFDRFNTTSPLYSFLKKNKKVTPYLGVVDNNIVLWHKLGTFWTTAWNVPEEALVATLTARDLLERMRSTLFYRSAVYENYTAYQLFEVILQDYGLLPQMYEIDALLQTISIPYAWWPRVSHRDALQQLASCLPVFVYVSRDNKIKVVHLQTLQGLASQYTFDKDKNVFSRQFPLAWSQIINYVEVTAKQRTVDIVENMYNDTIVTTVPASDRITVTYVYKKCPVLNASLDITAPPEITVETFSEYAWGAIVTYYNTGLVDADISAVSISGQTLKVDSEIISTSKDDILIRDNGFEKASIAHDFIQTSAYADYLSALLLDMYKDSKYNAKLETRGHVSLAVGAATLLSDMPSKYVVVRQNLTWDGSLASTVETRIFD